MVPGHTSHPLCVRPILYDRTYFCIVPACIDRSQCVAPHTFRRTCHICTIYCGLYKSVLVVHLKCVLWERNYWSWTGYQKALCCRQRRLRELSQHTLAVPVNVSTEVRIRTFPPKILSVCKRITQIPRTNLRTSYCLFVVNLPVSCLSSSRILQFWFFRHKIWNLKWAYVHFRAGHEGPKMEWKYSSTLSLT